MKKKYFLLNRPIPPELCHQEEILVQGQKGGVVKFTGEYNLTPPPPLRGGDKKSAQGREFKVYKEREGKKGKKKEKNGRGKGKKGEKKGKKKESKRKMEGKRSKKK